MLSNVPSLIVALLLSGTAVSGNVFHRRGNHEGMSPAYNKRQVVSPHRAAWAWEHRGNKGQYHQPSNPATTTTPCRTTTTQPPRTTTTPCRTTTTKKTTTTTTTKPRTTTPCKTTTTTKKTTTTTKKTTTTTTKPRTTTPCKTTTTTKKTTTTTRPATTKTPCLTTTVRTTTTSRPPPATCTPQVPKTCKSGKGVRDLTPYTISGSGLTLPGGSKCSGQISYQAISCREYKYGQTFDKKPNSWNSRTFGTKFDPWGSRLNGNKYFGQSYYGFDEAKAAFPEGYCIVWASTSLFGQRFGEGGQYPVCSENCRVTC